MTKLKRVGRLGIFIYVDIYKILKYFKRTRDAKTLGIHVYDVLKMLFIILLKQIETFPLHDIGDEVC